METFQMILTLLQEEIYKMSSWPRGRALIINIREFDDDSRTRKGSEFDVLRLNKLFSQLGFDVMIWDTKERCQAEVCLTQYFFLIILYR